MQWNEQTKKLSELVPYGKNPRKISKEQLEKLKRSISEDGFHQRLLVTQDGRVIGGHQRIKALKELGYKEVECLVPSRELTDEEYDRLNIRDNLQAGECDFDALANHFDPEQLLDWGFPENLLPKQEGVVNEPEGDEDEAPEAPAVAKTVRGDVYEIGPHRLMCGDSTLIDDVDKLMGGAKADMVFTDPPYGMSYGGGRAVGKSDGTVKGFGVIKGDDARGDELIALIKDALGCAAIVSKAGAAWYVCFPWRTYSEFEAALPKEPKSCIVWDKQSIGLGSNKGYRPQHEFMFYLAGDEWHGDRAQSDVWQCKRAAVTGYVHPTQKPVELIERALGNSSKAGDGVVDVFGGSGSTMVAAHKLGRTAYLMELDEKYCDVIVNRMRKLYPNLEIKRNGEAIEWQTQTQS